MARPRDAFPPAQRRIGQYTIWAELAHGPGDVATQLDGGRQPAVEIAVKKRDLADAEFGRRRPLLRLPQHRHLVPRSVIETTGVASRDDQVSHLKAVGYPSGQGAPGAELGIVGMGEDGEHPLDVRKRRRRRRKAHELDQLAAAGAEEEQRELGAVGAEGVPEPAENLLLTGEYEPGATGGDPGHPDFVRDRRPFLPQFDDLLVDLIEASSQARDVFVGAGVLGVGGNAGVGWLESFVGLLEDRDVHRVLLGRSGSID
jgi:hypothetical protein